METARSQVKDLLRDTHVLIVDDEDANRSILVEMFKTLGATTWACDSQLCAISSYFKLYKKRLKPRVVISDWWLSDPQSPEFETMKMTNTLERHGTCAMLFESIHDMDPGAFMCIYTNDVDAARHGMDSLGLQHVEIFSKKEIDQALFAKKIAMHKGISRQRVMASSIIQMALEEVQHETNTTLKIIKQPS